MSQNSKDQDRPKVSIISEQKMPAPVSQHEHKPVGDVVEPPKALDLSQVRLRVVKIRKLAEGGERVKALLERSDLYRDVLVGIRLGTFTNGDVKGLIHAATEAEREIDRSHLPPR